MNMNRILGIVLGVGIVIFINNYINDIRAENKEIKKQNSCYQLLYNEDYIGVGCIDYFKNDEWYIDYIKQVKESKKDE